MASSFIVTGGARGVGRAVVERLLADGGAVVVLDLDEDALAWVGDHADAARIAPVIGSAADRHIAESAADRAESLGPLTGWVNNAAVFRDATLDEPSVVMELIAANLAPVVVGCAVAVGRFRRAGTGGAIVNISSHQAQRAVRGALPYATAKAAVEGLTRAVAVDHGPDGVRTNAIALGSIATERYAGLLAELDPAAARDVERQMAQLHPLGRVGTVAEVADTVAFLLSPAAGFINGAVIPVDGGRAAWGPDPEAR